MATKAERFRYEAQRSSAPAKKTKKKNGSAHEPSRGRKAVFALETTEAAVPPSRKSTRKGKNRQKAATPLTSRNLLTKSSPKARHDVGPPRLRAPR